ncbi:hypothetical protein [Roseibium alexandrii]|jgi:surface antigen|uniref:Surface antigen n=2 Tax=Roseibium alexandrii TaxID=388408 RepID=A0A0M7AHG4_9HYPH|nr:hypothetical protein [Roseibium alexandrii]EEE43500.2 hypothetical protein SADFL11_786 [Roseibium alexandrii DFL-11]CTQ74021.1 Surface antigen [Roseibium alexandrii]
MTFDEKKSQVDLAQDIGLILDNEMPPEARDELLIRLQADADSAELMKQMAADQALLQEVLPPSVPDATIKRLESVIEREFDRRAPKAGSDRHWSRAIVYLAASLVLVAGTFAVTNFWMQSRMDQVVASLAVHMETERLALAQTVQEALETKVSGEPVAIGQDGDWSEILTPIKTYKSKSGHWCRQYLRETRFGKLDMTIRGTACRDENGVWTTVFAEPVSDNFSPQTNGI